MWKQEHTWGIFMGRFFNALVDFPVSSTRSILMNVFISYQVYWKTFVNVHSLHVIMIYTASTRQRILESKSASRTWDPCRPALKQLQLLYTAGAILHANLL